jgi:hypothetical protein
MPRPVQDGAARQGHRFSGYTPIEKVTFLGLIKLKPALLAQVGWMGQVGRRISEMRSANYWKASQPQLPGGCSAWQAWP